MHKKINTILLTFCALALLVSNAFWPKKDFSEKENRYLKAWPNFTFESLIDGDYTKGISDYFNDHILLRDEWISIYSLSNRLTFKDEVNGVYFSKNKRLIEKYTAMERPDLIARSINAFAQANDEVKVQVMLVETAVVIHQNDLPPFAINGDQDRDYHAITDVLECEVIDVNSALEGFDDSFYRTDHHWTSRGAYRAYQVYCQKNGIKAHSLQDYQIETVSENFYGTIASKTNDFFQSPDRIEKYSLENENITVMYGDEETDSLYDAEKLQTVDQYAYFLNGNHPIVTIINNNINAGENLLIIKDSYANCFVPFLIDHYQSITLIDPRYYGFSIHEYLQASGIQHVLFLYNMNTIGDDTGIRGIE